MARKKKSVQAAAVPLASEPVKSRGKPPWVPTEEILVKVRELAALGLMDRDIAYRVGIHPHGFSSKKSEYPELAEAIKEGQAEGIERHAAQLEVHGIKNLGATIFYLKCKGGWKEDGSSKPGDGGESKDSIEGAIQAAMAALEG